MSREIPEKICELESLQSFIAINNQIESLPSELFTLPEILKVDISNNKLKVRHTSDISFHLHFFCLFKSFTFAFIIRLFELKERRGLEYVDYIRPP